MAEPAPEELAKRSALPLRKVRLILESCKKPLSLETPIGEDSDLGDFLEDKRTPSPVESLLSDDLTADGGHAAKPRAAAVDTDAIAPVSDPPLPG